MAACLWNSLLVTLSTTFEGFLLAAVGGICLAILFNQSRLVEYSLYPYAVILQVTPIVAIAPLLLIYLPQPWPCSPAHGSSRSFRFSPIRRSG